ncbi:MAG: DUF4411 family protein [Planctomycetota bacterium]
MSKAVKYVIDADCLITAKNQYYAFDICPGFWVFIEACIRQKAVIGIAEVYDEIIFKNDELSEWAKEIGRDVFVNDPADQSIPTGRSAVSQRVDRNPQYTSAAKAEFLRGADPLLITHAWRRGHTIVTLERSAPDSRKDIKIPDIARSFGVNCISPFAMLRVLGANFVRNESKQS